MGKKSVLIPLVVFAFFGWASPQIIDTNSDCRMCPEECQSVPRSDGSCSICICNGVALPDCPKLLELCPRNCVIQHNEDGCSRCVCKQQYPVICPLLQPCPDQCTVEVGEDGCLSCRCHQREICPTVRPCLRGCIEMDEENGCITCTCTLLGEDPVSPFGENDIQLPNFRCRFPRLQCPPECRIIIASHGCRECLCGNDTYLCPLVPACSHDCLFNSPEDMCYRCNFSQPLTEVLSFTVVQIPSFTPFSPFGQFGPFRPFGQFGPISPFRPFEQFGPFGQSGPIRPSGPFGQFVPFSLFGPYESIRPNTGFGRNPFLPPLSSRLPGNNCTVDPATCNPRCRVITDSDGCPLCQCPDPCPRCPSSCVHRPRSTGCPDCDCGVPSLPTQPDSFFEPNLPALLDASSFGSDTADVPVKPYTDNFIPLTNVPKSPELSEHREICSAVRPCLRACIEMDRDSGCFICNCTLLSEDPVRPSGEDDNSLQKLRCRSSLRLECPSTCRIVIPTHGCRECFCGNDTYLCPLVPPCSLNCLFETPEDKCIRCYC